MARTNSLLLVFMLFAALSHAGCTGNITHYVPAVVGSGGGLVNATISLVPGTGRVYAGVYPEVGMMTQQSIYYAVNYAYQKAGLSNDCDVLVSFQSFPATNFIDGPSAGASLSVMAYSLIENKTLRDDAIITGTIDPSGNIGPVGGLYEKAKSAAAGGAKYFITPIESVYESLMLKQVQADYGIKVLQAENASEVIDFMVDDVPIPDHNQTPQNRSIPRLTRYGGPPLDNFKQVALDMIALENQALASIPNDQGQDSIIHNYFTNELARQSAILASGYSFSAANEAFSNYIDLSTVSVILSGTGDPLAKRNSIQDCLAGISTPALTDQNFEWVIGSDVRNGWASHKINSLNLSGSMIMDEKYSNYNELMYADAWCHVAKSLVNAAPSGGNLINESDWKSLATTELSKAKSTVITSPETASKLASAESDYNLGKYGAAIYDSSYVISIENSSAQPTASPADRDGKIITLLAQNFTSLWANIYQSQGAFLYGQNDSSGAYAVLSYARALDSLNSQLVQNASTMDNAQIQLPPSADSGNNAILIALVAVAAIFLLIKLLIPRWRSNENNSTKRGRFYRPKGQDRRSSI